MLPIRKPAYAARFATDGADLRAAQRLRHAAFIEGTGAAPRPAGLDSDDFDARCHHVLVEHRSSGELVCCFRLLPVAGNEIAHSYSAQYYELSALADYPGPMVELGRFCVRPGWRDPDILRIAWAAMTRYVDERGVELLFGCSSFHGTDAGRYRDAFAKLRQDHLAPRRWLPRVKAADVVRFAQRLRRQPDPRRAARLMPPLLRTYLAMGGWVSDHAVIDRDMNTLHVFTGLEIRAIPPARAQALRAAATALHG